jgi:hypothetical protein
VHRIAERGDQAVGALLAASGAGAFGTVEVDDVVVYRGARPPVPDNLESYPA